MTPNKKKVLLPNTMAKAGWDVLADRDDIEAVPYEPYISMPDFQVALRDTDGVALSLTPLKAPEIAVAPRLRVAARIGVGYDAVEIPALTARGIPLMVVGTANSVSVAEHAIFMMYALAKKVMFHDAAVRDNRWQDRWKDVPFDLAGKTLLIVGFGHIGARLAALAKAFGMRVIALKRDPSTSIGTADAVLPQDRLLEQLPTADYVALTCPLTRETERMINAQALAAMKPSAFLINVARGRVVDEPALIAALAEKRIAGAGIDCTVEEPLPADSPLWGFDNALITPHTAGETRRYEDNVIDLLLENLDRLWRGETVLKNQVV